MGEKAKTLLREKGLKATASRLAMLSFLEKQEGPVSQQDIVNGIGRKADQSTLYRIVQDFLAAGLIRQVPGAPARFELTTLPHHHHFVCTQCGAIEDIDICNVEAIAKKALKESTQFSSISGHSLDFFGTCKKCS